ncbi:redoxin domain-containing protein [Stieleria sp. JC731]|uniref:redoxin domain-containing protein n=1 Tax=Pirellulaceae TaxID=2691357 RepID=UPI001E3801AD|nr:redoxin domain-containing protein [Stieleria sp. JC731]MCC9599098.1 redoxin domain-containing protein [Stieleria sp. JC731]
MSRPLCTALQLIVLLCHAPNVGAIDPVGTLDSTNLSPISVIDADGDVINVQTINVPTLLARKPITIIFVKHDCPVANSYMPTLNRLFERVDRSQMNFAFVYPSQSISVADVESHCRQYQIKVPVYIDTDLQLARTLDATVTPEAVVLDSTGAVRYRGRIDDRIVGYGKRRPSATRDDLAEAITDVLSNHPVRVPETKAIGCIIPR